MSDWKKAIRQFGLNMEEQFDELKWQLKRRLDSVDPVLILPYRGHGSPQELYLKGRLLEDEGITVVTDNDTVWENLLAMYRRFESDEVPQARLQVQFQDVVQEVVTDEEGYFEVQLRPDQPLPGDVLWHRVQLHLLDEIAPDQGSVRSVGEVLVPPPGSEFGVISDIDDTIVKTYATHWLRVARVTFLGNARTRLPFHGVAAFYRALQRGTGDTSYNPIFYVSSSPWNLYDLLVDFMELQSIPAGPLFLRDLGFDEHKFIKSGHHEHKLNQIGHILETHADLPFILVGDSGQQDPEIYRQVVKIFPGRIQAIYIRDVTLDERDAAVRTVAESLRQDEVEMLLVPDTVAAAEHAADRGFINAELLPSIRAEKSQDAG
jgi:phosphatidate phosphatase APP1